MRIHSESVCDGFPSRKPFRFILLLALLIAAALPTRAALVAYWPFNEGSGMVAGDMAGYTDVHNGNLATGAQTPAWVPGRFGGALGFTWQSANNPGSGRLVTVPYHTNLTLNGPFTISYWYRMDAATPSGTFPGIMRIGSQSATTGNNVGWGFFRTANMVYKRGNNQPGIYAPMSVGQWYHVALRFDGNLTGNNTIAFLNGVQTTFAAVNGWSNVTSMANFEIGRMDAFDQATLDDLALWRNEAVAPAKIRSLYTVPVSLNLDYSLTEMQSLWTVFDGGAGSSATVKGATWSYAASLPGTPALGDAYISGPNMYVALTATTGVSAPLTTLSGRISPDGIGVAGTFMLAGVSGGPVGATNANLVYDLRTDNTIGGGTNDYINITGDFNIANSIVTVNPLMPLSGTYRLVDYSGAKAGSLVLSNTTRYELTLDESTTNQINLVAAGASATVKWNSTNNGSWDLSTSNWLNTASSAVDRFYQGDAVQIDDSGAFQTAITVATPVFPRSLMVNSSTRNYTISGIEQIGGASEGVMKAGTSILTLSTPNSFIGEVQVNAGGLRLGNAAALGSTNVGTVIASGATLDLGGFSPGLEPITVQGSGTTNAGAIVNTGGALSNNGLRGRVTLLGDTTIGGVNRWDMFGAVLVGNGFKLTKVGPPEIALSNLGDTGLGEVDVVQGTLTVLGNTRLGDNTKSLTVSNNAALAFWATGPTILDKPFVLRPGSILRNATSGNTDVTTNLGNVEITGDVFVQATANIALLGAISGSGAIIKQNAGTLYLGGTSTYSGRTAVTAGRLAMLETGTISSPRVELSNGTTLDTSRVPAGYTLANGQTLVGSGTVAGSLNVPTGSTVVPGNDNVAGTLPITNNLALSGGTLVFDITSASTEGAGVNDLVTVGGNLSLTGTTTLRINPLGLLTAGTTYTLINYTGALTGDASNLTLANDSRYTFSLSVATSGKVLLTVVSGEAETLAWLGGTTGAETLWDVRTTPNWSDSLGGPATFFAGDRVMFDDFGFPTTVDLVGALTPASVRIENGTEPYIFQGTGKLSGASSLTKLFDAKVTIANSNVNDYVGPTDIQAGTVQVGIGGNFGNLGLGPITNNGTLIYNRSDNLTFNNVLSGTGTLVKENNNTMSFSVNNSNYSGSLVATGGVIRPTIANGLGNDVGGTVIGAGATLDVNAVNLGAESVTVAGAGATGTGALINGSGTGQNNALRFVTLSGDATVGGAGRFDIRANPTATLLTGGNPYSLTKVGNNQFSLVDVAVDNALGDINVNAGIFSAELGTGAGDRTRTLTLASNATLQFFNRTIAWDKVHVLNGGSTVFNNSGANTMTGPVTLNGGTVTFNAGGTSLTLTDPIGGNGALTKIGTATLVLGADNTYPGPTTVTAGTLQLGTGTNAGWVAGPIAMGGNTLTVYRSDMVALSNAFSGTGTLNVRTPMGLLLDSAFNFGTINIGLTSPGRLVLGQNFTGNIGSVSAGDSPGGAYGELHQLGGALTVNALFRVGHWPNAVSTFLMGGGTLTLTATPAGVVNQNAVAEQNGVIYLGVDGTGVLVQTGGVIRAHGIVFDARGNTAGEDTYSLEGGQTILGPSGFKTGNFDANASYAINLGGGTLSSSANWTSVLAMRFTGTNGNTTFDTANNSNVLTGALTGPGGLIKAGTGTLALTGNAAYSGGTRVTAGTLLVRGSLGAGANVVVEGGTLAGDGALNDALTVNAGGTLSPGPGITRLTINEAVTLNGNTVLQIEKTGTDLTNDVVNSSGTVTFGGTLTVTASGDALAAGDVFKLFNGSSFIGTFATLDLPALTGSLAWDLSQLAVDGTIRVGAPAPKLGISSSGNSISLTWSNGNDFTLQAQTNAPGIGIQTNNWVDVTNGANGSVTFPIDTTAGSIFYRLIKP